MKLTPKQRAELHKLFWDTYLYNNYSLDEAVDTVLDKVELKEEKEDE